MDASPAPSAPWRVQAVFISSTFKDMHAERDHLRHHVFPAVAERLRARRCHVEPVDLRIGVETVELADESQKELKVLRVCLAEIERCRPFFLVLLGDRYGWVPPADRVAAAVGEAGFGADVAGKSVTALEIEFGVARGALGGNGDGRPPHVLFYFREPLPYEQMPPDVAARYSDAHAPDPATRAGVAHLARLKEVIARDPVLGRKVRRYCAAWDPLEQRVTGLDAFGRQAAEDLARELDEQLNEHVGAPETAGDAVPPAAADAEWLALEEFVEQHCRRFTGRAALLGQLFDHATSPPGDRSRDWGLSLTGGPGSGKSAVMARLARTLLADPSRLVLYHSAGVTPAAPRVDAMLRRWIGEMAGRLAIPNPLPDDAPPAAIDGAFAALLRRAAESQRVVLLLDATDQFEPTARARTLGWLPDPRGWPANARLIATSLPGDTAEHLEQWAGVAEVAMPPLDPPDAADVARRICAQYHRELHPAVLEALVEKPGPNGSSPASASPLWLTLATEQLNLVDADDFDRADRASSGTPEQRLHAALRETTERMPPDVPSLYGWMLRQNGRAFGGRWVVALAAAVASGRSGWRDADLVRLVPRVAELMFGPPGGADDEWDDLHFATVRRGFRGHLVRRGARGQWQFVHGQLGRLLLSDLHRDPRLTGGIEVAIADHLESLPADDPVREEELALHLIRCGDRARAARHLADADLTPAALHAAVDTLVFFLRAGDEERWPNPLLDAVLSLLDTPDLTAAQRRQLAIVYLLFVPRTLEVCGCGVRLQVRYVQGVMARIAAWGPAAAAVQGLEQLLACAHNSLGALMRASGDSDAALAAYRSAADLLARGEPLAPAGARGERRRGTPAAELADVLCEIAQILIEKGQTVVARQTVQRARAVAEANLRDAPDRTLTWAILSRALLKEGDCVRDEDVDAALRLYRRSLESAARAAPDARYFAIEMELSLATAHDRIGAMLRRRREFDEALTHFAENRAILERIVERVPSAMLPRRNLGVSHEKIGQVQWLTDDRDAALVSFRAAHAQFEACARADPGNRRFRHDASRALASLGAACIDCGRRDEADAALRAACARLLEDVLHDPGNAGWRDDLAYGCKLLDRLAARTDPAPSAFELRQLSADIRRRAVELQSRR